MLGTELDRDLGVAFLMHPGSQSLSRGEAKDSTLLSSCDGYLLVKVKVTQLCPTLRPHGL